MSFMESSQEKKKYNFRKMRAKDVEKAFDEMSKKELLEIRIKTSSYGKMNLLSYLICRHLGEFERSIPVDLTEPILHLAKAVPEMITLGGRVNSIGEYVPCALSIAYEKHEAFFETFLAIANPRYSQLADIFESGAMPKSPKVLELMAKEDIDLDHKFKYPEKTLLMRYVETPKSYRPEMVKTLLRCKADPNLKINSSSALDLVLQWDSNSSDKSKMSECVRLLMAGNANVTRNNILWFVYHGMTKFAEMYKDDLLFSLASFYAGPHERKLFNSIDIHSLMTLFVLSKRKEGNLAKLQSNDIYHHIMSFLLPKTYQMNRFLLQNK